VERATKSTFFLADSRRAKLKAIAVEHRTTVTKLLAEGADMVIDKYQSLGDRAELERRGALARERMREGYFSSRRGTSDRIDEILYPTRKRRR